MSSAFVRVSGTRATSARTTTHAGARSGAVPARPASKRLRPSRQPSGAPIRDVIIGSGGMRLSQIALVRSGIAAAIPPISIAAGGPSLGLRPAGAGSLREGDGAARLLVQRCGIGSSCDCPARDQLAGIEHDLQRATAAGGTPLPASSRERMESAFSFDFAAVRVHVGAAAHDAASALDARALTAGADILFRAGEYLPGTPAGDRLLAHELAHVVQQARGLPQSTLDTRATDQLETAARLAADHASPTAEREAHGAAMIAAMGEPVPALTGQPPTIARQDNLDDLGTQSDASIPGPPSDVGLPVEVATTPPDASPQIQPQQLGVDVVMPCHSCQLEGGVGVCCFTTDWLSAPNLDQCAHAAQAQLLRCISINDQESCLEQNQCDICQCLGQRYCQCSGIMLGIALPLNYR